MHRPRQRVFLSILATCVLVASIGLPLCQADAASAQAIPAGQQPAQGYTPSALPVEELPEQHPLIDLNLRFPAQDPDEVGPRIAAVLRAYNEQRAREPLAPLVASPEIEALARGLDSDPKLIYEYVHNHFETVPSWGLVKGPWETSLAKAGNPFDQAALLVALLQAAGHEAEFVFGLIQIPIPEAMNWVGVTNAEVLPYVFWNGGIPAEIAGNNLRINHVWARVRVGGVWYPLDPSFKSYASQQGVNLASAMGYNRDAFLSAATSGGTVATHSVRDINESGINGSLAGYATSLINHLDTQMPFAYVQEAIGGRQIVPQMLTTYPTQLPYHVESSWGETAALPDKYKWELRIELPGIDYQVSLPDILGQRLTVFYAGATAADRSALDRAGSVYDVDPAYEVNMVPQLRVGGSVAATGEAVSLGSLQPIAVTVITSILNKEGNPWVASYAPQHLRAGAWYALPMMFQSVSRGQLDRNQKMLVENMAAGLDGDSDQVLGQSLYLIGLSYFNELEYSQRLDAQIAGVVRIPHVSGMLMSQDLSVLEWAKIGDVWKAKRLGMAAYTVDVRLNWYSILSASGDANRERGYMTSSGHKSSAAEHAILEQLQNNPSVSTVKVLDIANEGGLKIYRLTQGNLESVLPLLDYSDARKASLRADVEAGYEVTVPERNISFNQWTGTAWVSFHPPSGSAGYWLSGGVGSVAGEPEGPPRRMGGGGSEPKPVYPSIAAMALAHGVGLSGSIPGNLNHDDEKAKAGDDPVDAASGAFVHGSTDLAFGVLGFPIRFARNYASSSSHQDGPLGHGWTHSYDIYLAQSSDWARGFGLRSAVDAAAAIAESYVGIDMASVPAGGLPQERIVIGTENSDWVLGWMIDNVGTVSAGNGEQHQYLHLPDGSRRPAHGFNTMLVQKGGGTYQVLARDGSQINFDGDGKALSLVGANGNQTTLTYDGAGNLTRVTDAAGRSIRLSYDDGHLTEIRDPLGRTYSYDYDGDDNLVRYTNACGEATVYTYDDEHRVETVTDPEGVTFTRNTYDQWGRVTGQVDGRGGTLDLRYGDLRTVEVDPLGGETVYLFDAYRRLAGQQDPLGYTTSTTYDAGGNPLTQTDANGGTTTLAYDARGNVVRGANALGSVTNFSYDGQDNLTGITDPLGRTTAMQYDANHNLTRWTDALGHSTAYAYDGKGHLTAVTDANGHTARAKYDQEGNLTETADALGQASTMAYDALGRLVSETNAEGHMVQYEYGDCDNLVSVTDPLGHVTAFRYDGNNRLDRVTDARGNRTNFAYDAGSNLTQVTDALSGTTRYQYDAGGRLTKITDAHGKATTNNYDAAGRLVQTTDPLGRTVRYAYDGNGNMVIRTKADGSVVHYEHDPLNRLTRAVYRDGGEAVFAYDAVGNMTAMGNGSSQASYTYNALDLLVRAELSREGIILSYGYDPAGNRKSLEGRRNGALLYQAQYNYDAADRLTRLVDGISSQTVSYTYDAAARVTQMVHTGGARTLYAYDGNGLVSRVDNVDGSGGIMSLWEYDRDAVGNIVRSERTTPASSLITSYTYDALDRLTGEIYARYRIGYEYDSVGNRTKMTSPLGTVVYSYDTADQMLQAGAETFGYDANGSQTSRVNALGSFTLRYDQEDRLVQVVAPGGRSTTYGYDPLGRRIRAGDAQGETRFIFDGASVILEEGPAPGAGQAYLHGNFQLVASRPSGASPGAPAVGYHGDALGSVVGISDTTGAARGAYAYDAFGRQTYGAGDVAQGQRYLGQLGVRVPADDSNLHLMGLRSYDASSGRFVTTDPWPGTLLHPPTLHSYAYALSNPLRYIDPAGLCATPAQGSESVPLLDASHLGPEPPWMAKQLLYAGRQYRQLQYSPLRPHSQRGFLYRDRVLLSAVFRIVAQHAEPEARVRSRPGSTLREVVDTQRAMTSALFLALSRALDPDAQTPPGWNMQQWQRQRRQAVQDLWNNTR